MKTNLRKAAAAILCAVMLCGISLPVYADEKTGETSAAETSAVTEETSAEEAPAEEASVKDGWSKKDGKKYYTENGKILKNCVKKIDGKYYAFGKEGYMLTDGIFNVGSKKYSAGKDGVLDTEKWVRSSRKSVGKATYYYAEKNAEITVYELELKKVDINDYRTFITKNGKEMTSYKNFKNLTKPAAGRGLSVLFKFGDHYYRCRYTRDSLIISEGDQMSQSTMIYDVGAEKMYKNVSVIRAKIAKDGLLTSGRLVYENGDRFYKISKKGLTEAENIPANTLLYSASLFGYNDANGWCYASCSFYYSYTGTKKVSKVVLNGSTTISKNGKAVVTIPFTYTGNKMEANKYKDYEYSRGDYTLSYGNRKDEFIKKYLESGCWLGNGTKATITSATIYYKDGTSEKVPLAKL